MVSAFAKGQRRAQSSRGMLIISRIVQRVFHSGQHPVEARASACADSCFSSIRRRNSPEFKPEGYAWNLECRCGPLHQSRVSRTTGRAWYTPRYTIAMSKTSCKTCDAVRALVSRCKYYEPLAVTAASSIHNFPKRTFLARRSEHNRRGRSDLRFADYRGNVS